MINKDDDTKELVLTGAHALHQMAMYSYYTEYLKVNVDREILQKYQSLHAAALQELECTGIDKLQANALMIKQMN